MRSEAEELQTIATRHLRWGWTLLALFVVLGICLEAMHGFKVDWYLHASNETRRLTWRLAHAHGTFLAIVHLLFGQTVDRLKSVPRRLGWISSGISVASLFVPLGFFLGGLKIYDGDPGPGIALLPVGALVLLVALVDFALAMPEARLARSAADSSAGRSTRTS
ncbi:MAG: hypothetical protein U0795_24190 [Pirellulales bacterium]